MKIQFESEFRCGDRVHLVLNPLLKGQTVCIQVWNNSNIDYKVTYLDVDGNVREGIFFPYELESEEAE